MSKIRLFFGVKISMEAVRALEQEVRSLQRQASDAGLAVRWVSPASYHVTLKFLGWCRPELVSVLQDQVAPLLAELRSAELTVRGLGAFPSADKARVLWAGATDAGDSLARAAAVLDESMEQLGFKREKRDFRPHVTLARLQEFADVTPLVQGRTEQEYSTCSVRSVQLFESELSTVGAEYPTRASWPLGKQDQRARL